MSSRRDDFQAGIAGAIIWFLIIAIFTAHGSSDNTKVSWSDIIQFLFLTLIFALSVIDLHNYYLRGKKQKTDRTVHFVFDDGKQADGYWQLLREIFNKTKGDKSE